MFVVVTFFVMLREVVIFFFMENIQVHIPLVTSLKDPNNFTVKTNYNHSIDYRAT